MAVLGLLMAALIFEAPRVRIRPLRRPPSEIDVLVIARLLALAVSSGRPMGVALADTRERIDGAGRLAVDDVLSRARRTGLARALAESSGPLGDLAGRLARAQITGAPIGPVLDTYIAMVNDARRARALEDARTLGVKLILPLTLLLLPGFVALVVAPFVLEQVAGLFEGTVP